jgi:hypothetical protein
MRRILLVLLFIPDPQTKAHPPVNYCNRLDVLTKSAIGHFSNLIKINRKDFHDSTRYMTGISSISDDVGYIYSAAGNESAYICRLKKNEPQEVENTDNAIWAGLLLRPGENWQRRKDNNNIIFKSRVTGIQVTLFNNQGWLFIQIQNNPLLLAPVLSTRLCEEIDTVIHAFTDNFIHIRGEIIESKDDKKVYQSKIRLNHKLHFANITETTDSFLDSVSYEYRDFFSGLDYSVNSIINQFDSCLLYANSGWVKSSGAPGIGIETYQNKILTVNIYHRRLKDGEPEDIVISIKKTE